MKKKLTLKWDKVILTKGYAQIPNQLFLDLSSNAEAMALLLLILSQESEHYKSKEEIYKLMGWPSIKNVRKWLDCIKYLKEKGYASGDNGDYTFYKYPIKEERVTKSGPKMIFDDSNIPSVSPEYLLNRKKEQDYFDVNRKVTDEELPF